MENFNYHRPNSLEEAKAALSGAEEGKYLGGGQSLLPVMKLDMAMPSDLVSVAHLDALHGISVDGDTLVIGAGTTHADVNASDAVKGAIPSLAALAGHIGDAQVRNRGTLGGSIAHADPAADYPAAVLALKGQIKTDKRVISCDDYFTGMFETALEEGEIITAVHFAKPEKAWYAKFENPASKYAIVGVMVAKYADGVRVTVTGAGPMVFRVPEMEAALTANFSADALNGIKVSSDELNDEHGASPEYRAHLVTVMAKRAVDAAV